MKSGVVPKGENRQEGANSNENSNAPASAKSFRKPVSPFKNRMTMAISPTLKAVPHPKEKVSPSKRPPVPKFTTVSSCSPNSRSAGSPGLSENTRYTSAVNIAGSSSSGSIVGPNSCEKKRMEAYENLHVLQTIHRQSVFLRLRLRQTAENETKKAEDEILKAWKTVYDAEEEASNLRAKLAVAEKIIDIHKQLHKMDIAMQELRDAIIPAISIVQKLIWERTNRQSAIQLAEPFPNQAIFQLIQRVLSSLRVLCQQPLFHPSTLGEASEIIQDSRQITELMHGCMNSIEELLAVHAILQYSAGAEEYEVRNSSPISEKGSAIGKESI